MQGTTSTGFVRAVRHGRAPRSIGWLLAIGIAVAFGGGCKSSGEQGGPSTSTATGGGGEGAGGYGGSEPIAISLPQLIDGAALANPTVYESIPLTILTDVAGASVTVWLGEEPFDADSADDSGTFVATLPIAGLPDGVVPLAVTASAYVGDEPERPGFYGHAEGELVISAAGVQLTSFAEVGFAGVPRPHRRGDELWLTWTDRSEPDAEAWLRRIDGAGRWKGDRIRIGGEEGETLYARTAFGKDAIGVLYQLHGGPYQNYFKLVGYDGSEVMAPVALDPEGFYGSSGGDVIFDGEAFIACWRVNDGEGKQKILWLRLTEDDQKLTGPVVVAENGDGKPHGDFLPISAVSVAALGDVSVVAFDRDYYHPTLAMLILKSQYVRVDETGKVVSEGFFGDAKSYTFHREARVVRREDEIVAVWSAIDLMDPNDNPPNLFYAARSNALAEFTIKGKGAVAVDAPDDRDEPFFLGGDDPFGVLAWTDHRAYTLDPPNGHIDLMAAPMDESLATAAPTVFHHARFIAGTSELRGVPAGRNVVLLWVDERHGQGLMDPKPEMWLETFWQ